MPTTLQELADLVSGEVVGDGLLEIHGAATLSAAGPNEISLLDDPNKLHLLKKSSSQAIVVPSEFANEQAGQSLLKVSDARAAFARIVMHFRPPRTTRRIGVSPAASVSPSASTGDDVDIHPGANIGDDVVIEGGCTIHANVTIMAGSHIGPQVTIFPGATLYENTVIGARTIVHAGVVLGAYGFGYESSTGQHILSVQLGYVRIGEDVEIGAGTTIDRGTYGPTVIGDGTKIDNLVMIAHNCRVGRHNLICSQVGIAGSTTTGDYVVMAGQVGVRDHVHIGTGAVLAAMAGIMNDVPDGETYAGVPATPIKEQAFKQAALGKLPEMRKQLKKMQRAIEQLEKREANISPAAA